MDHGTINEGSICEGPLWSHRKISARRVAFTLVELLVVISIVGVLVSLSLNGVQSAREAARRVQCSNNLRQQALALHAFHATHNSLPLGDDSDQGRNQSWSSAILPQLEQSGIYEQWDRKVPWNDPVRNAALANTVISTFRCPSSILDSPGDTDYAGIQGSMLGALPVVLVYGNNNGVLISSTPMRRNPVSLTEIVDGTSYTAFIAEVVDRLPDEHGLWADGDNIMSHDNGGINIENSGEIFSFHPGGAYVALADGSVRFVTESVTTEIIGGMCTRGGREDLDSFFEN